MWFRQTPAIEVLIEGLISGTKVKFEVTYKEEGMGRGVISLSPIVNGEFVVEYEVYKVYNRYVTVLCNNSVSYLRSLCRKDRNLYEEECRANGEGNFIYDVQDPLSKMWICMDATRAYGTIGRLINHSAKPNLRAKVARVEGKLRLGFLACKDIVVGEELFFDYGRQPNPPSWLRRR